MFKLDEFSDTILELTVLAREESVDLYQQKALAAVQRILPFEMAWWGMMSPHDGSFLLHSSHLFNLPIEYVAIWEQVKRDDNVAKAVRQLPRRTAYFDEKNLAAARFGDADFLSRNWPSLLYGERLRRQPNVYISVSLSWAE